MSVAGRPLATLFVTGWNQADTIGPAIEAAFAQTYRPLEILLSDDASDDGTAERMQAAAAAYAGPHAVRALRATRNGGIVGNVNRVMEAAQGELIAMAGGDDLSAPQRVARLVEVWEAGGRRAHLLHSAAAVIDADGRIVGRREGAGGLRAARTPQEVLAADRTALGASMAWTRTLWERFGPLPEAALVEDLLLTFRAALLGPILYLDEELVSWRQGGVSWTPPRPTRSERLRGAPFRLVRWRAAACQALLADLDRIEHPDREEIRALAAAQADRLDLHAALAEADAPGLARLAPRAARQALRDGSTRPLKLVLQYLLDRPRGR